jgi:hypothetical protein
MKPPTNELRAEHLAQRARAAAVRGERSHAEEACLEALAFLDVNAHARIAAPVLRRIGETYVILGRTEDARRVLRLALGWSHDRRDLPRLERVLIVAALADLGDVVERSDSEPPPESGPVEYTLDLEPPESERTEQTTITVRPAFGVIPNA